MLTARIALDDLRGTPSRMRSRSSVRFIQPMALQLVTELPEGNEWGYEVKFDGYRALLLRALLLKDGDRIAIRSRNDRDLTRTYPDIASHDAQPTRQNRDRGRGDRCPRP
jgi:ATP-dependent DNA ligase